MRRQLEFLAIVLLATGLGLSAQAAPLNFEQSTTTRIADLPSIDLSGGGVATVNGSGAIENHLVTFREAASRGGVAGTATILITDPETEGNGVAQVILQLEGGTGTLGNISGAVTGGAITPNTLPVRGVTKICLISTACNSFLNLIMTQPTTVNGVAGTGIKGVGVGGVITVGGGTNTIRISVQGAPWTINTTGAIDQTTTTGGNTTFVTVTAKGFAHGPASGTTSTADVSGVVQIVTPVQVVTNVQFGSNKKLGGVVTVVTKFIPEPGLLLLLGAGVVGLATLGRRRMK